MAWGLIPITTDIGFNRTVVGNDTLIVKDLSPKSFASVITRIIEGGEIQDLSKQAYQRIQNNYTEVIIYNKLKEEYNTLFKLQSFG